MSLLDIFEKSMKMCNQDLDNLDLDLIQEYLYKNNLKELQKYLLENIDHDNTNTNSILLDYIKNIIQEKHKHKKPKIYIYTSGLGDPDNYKIWTNYIYPDLLKYNHDFCIIHFDERLTSKHIFDNQLAINININFNRDYAGHSSYLTFDNLPGVYNKKYIYFDLAKIQDNNYYNLIRI